MDKLYPTIEDICHLKKSLISDAKCLVEKGLDSPGFTIEELGEIVDMIKDCAEAEEKCYKAEYYKEVTEAMKNPEATMRALNYPHHDGNWSDTFVHHRNEDDPDSRKGYDKWRFSDGRFAPKGEGHRSGFHETPNSSMMYSAEDVKRMEDDLRHGTAWKNYSTSRRYYTETGNEDEHKKMDEHAKQHVMNFIETAREIYKTASPELRKRIKEDLTKLVGEMTY